MSLSISTNGLRDQVVESVRAQCKSARAADKSDASGSAIVTIRDYICSKIMKEAEPGDRVYVSASFSANVSVTKAEPATAVEEKEVAKK